MSRSSVNQTPNIKEPMFQQVKRINLVLDYHFIPCTLPMVYPFDTLSIPFATFATSTGQSSFYECCRGCPGWSLWDFERCNTRSPDSCRKCWHRRHGADGNRKWHRNLWTWCLVQWVCSIEVGPWERRRHHWIWFRLGIGDVSLGSHEFQAVLKDRLEIKNKKME